MKNGVSIITRLFSFASSIISGVAFFPQASNTACISDISAVRTNYRFESPVINKIFSSSIVRTSLIKSELKALSKSFPDSALPATTCACVNFAISLIFTVFYLKLNVYLLGKDNGRKHLRTAKNHKFLFLNRFKMNVNKIFIH